MLKLNRRLFVFSGIALAGCQTTGVSIDSTRVLTSKYDGKYEIIVERIWRPIPENIRDPYYRTSPEPMAFLKATAVGGIVVLDSVDDKGTGPVYEDFKANFYEGGIFEMSSTVGISVGTYDPYRLRVTVPIGEQLLSGQWISFEPNGYTPKYGAHITMRKVG
jgi:hypothetical protein